MLDRIAILALATSLLVAAAARGQDPALRPADFASAIDLTPFAQCAVHTEGRLKSFDSFARQMMQVVSGPRRYEGQSAAFTYLDLVLRPDRYRDADIIYVKKKPIRARIVEALEQSPVAAEAGFAERMDRFMSRGLISERLLMEERVTALLQTLSADLIRTAKPVREIQSALTVKQPEFLFDRLAVIPDPKGVETSPWLTFRELILSDGAASPRLAAMPPELLGEIDRRWRSLVTGWFEADVDKTNAAIAGLAAALPRVRPELYPDQSRLAWENWYFRLGNLTWIWLVYLVCLVPLLASVIYRWPAARWIGIGLFAIAFGLHTFAFALRWYVAGRFPNSNMFEAVTTSVWFGGICAIVLEVLVRRTPMRNFFLLGSAVASMTAMLAVHFLPLYLDANISNRMPVLYDVWLYIHTNVIIFSYALIFIATIPAVGYLLYRVIGAFRGFGGPDDYARVGGAGSLIVTTPEGGTYLTRGRASMGQVLDGVTMVLLELAFIMLWAGLVMGAIWADHSWGRPWGWDPKEVFALNTFIVFAILVHMRLKSADKGMWTAVLALAGAAVMLFNWIVINFVITGLHSYA